MIDAGEAVVRGHETFRSALLALSYPGRRSMLPRVGDVREAAELLVDSLWDRETPICRPGSDAGAPRGGPEHASVMIVDGLSSSGTLLRLPRGTDEAPERGATAVYVVVDDTAAVRVTLSGPGVDGRLTTRLPLDSSELLARAEACAEKPRGVDVLVVHDGGVVGLPRTTHVAIEA